MKVSVVVPVYNPGRYITDLVDSLRAQTLDPAEFEAVFVDDGSTDGTGDLLDRLAATTPNMRVVHIPNSGWPGRPRNVGLDAAQGDYVFVSDHDDRLDPEALERLTAFADEHGPDVVIGKVVGVGRSAPTHIFAKTVIDAQEDPGLLMTSLTPQKLYRRAFLNERGIRFPEGRRRLEDHLFVTTAYLRAKRVSIYADHPIYYFVIRDDGQNASRQRVEWHAYFANAAESIEVVDAEAPDERTRIVMRSRWLRKEALGRVRGQRLLDRGSDRGVLVDAVRDLLERYYPLDEIDRLTANDRVAARLVLDHRDEDLLAFATWEASVRVEPLLEAARIDRSTSEVRVDLSAVQRVRGARPGFLAEPLEGWPAPAEFETADHVPHGVRAQVRLRHAGSGTIVKPTMRQSISDGTLRATATVDLAHTPEVLREGRWVLQVTFRGLRKVRAEPLTVQGGRRTRIDPDPQRRHGRLFRLEVGDAGRLLLRVEPVTSRTALRGVRRALARLRPGR